MIRLRLLGTVDLRDSEGRELGSVLRRPKLLALLGYLSVARPQGFQRRDTLVALLWPELDHTHARNALSQAVHTLRRALGHAALLARGEEELGASQEGLWCDVREFETALEHGRAEQALELYRGGLLNGLHVSDVPEFERWLDEERERLRRRACEAAQLLTEREATAGNPVGAAGWALRLTDLSPFDETAVRRLVELLDGMGDRAGAVRAYEEFERRLGRDLELEPSSATQGLIAGIRARRQIVAEAAAAPDAGALSGVSATEPGAARRGPGWGDTAPRPRTVRRRVPVLITAVVGGLLAVGWLLAGKPFGARSAETARASQRIVVLPFTNLGRAEQEYFADGVTEEITARLSAIGDLRVIGSTSATAYKGTKKAISHIARELGVDYVLEGSVRWETSPEGRARVRVTPQLVSTADGTHLWAQVYDEPLDEIFRVQSDIAQKVVQALDLTLLEPQRRTIEAVPTRNLRAYDYYLRGNEYMRRGGEERGQRTALRMYEKAVELDSGFALAYAMLSRMRSRLYLFHYDRSPEGLAAAKRAVDRALELAPGLPDAHHSLGTYYWLGFSNYDRALREFAIAEAARPNDSQLLYARATLRQRQGHLREALVDFERAQQLDPALPGIAGGYGQTYMMLRDFPRAEAQFERAIALSPDAVEPYFNRVMVALRGYGSTPRARAVLDEARTVGIADEPYLVMARVSVELFDRRYQAARDVISSKAPEVFQDQNRFVPRSALYAQVYRLTGRHDLERIYCDSARVAVIAQLREHPDDPRLHSALGVAYAGLGRKDDAIQEGKKAVELLPVTNEAFRGYRHEHDLARIYTMVGDYDTAVSRLEYLLSIPGWLTPAWLRIDPDWDPLRGNLRFQRLLARSR
jgi:TolB-like protein/DNA-binding SARP family transcriptional activator/Flp pilus assembly protein TadD